MQRTFSYTLALSFFSISLLSGQYTFGKPEGSWGFVVGSEMGFRSYTTEDSILFHEVVAREGKRRSLRIGVNRSYHINDDFYFKTGLRFSDTGYQSWVLPNVRLREDESSPISSNRSSEVARHTRLELPLALRHLFMSERCGMYVEAGLSPQLLLVQYKLNDGTLSSERDDGRGRFSLMGTFSIGTEWYIRKLPVFIEYAVRYQVTPTNINGIREREVGIGFELGTRKYF